jgi:hypothetical protein
MLEVRVFINDRAVGLARARNIGGPDSSCDYFVTGASEPSPVTGGRGGTNAFHINGHNRVQAAWALVAKIAAELAAVENAALCVSGENPKGEDPGGLSAGGIPARSSERGDALFPSLSPKEQKGK